MIYLDIINDGTGNDIVGNYDVGVYLPGDGWINARVEHHTRSNGWESLVYLAVKALQQAKGGENDKHRDREPGGQAGDRPQVHDHGEPAAGARADRELPEAGNPRPRRGGH